METKNPDEFVLMELEFLDQYEHFLVLPERPTSGGLALFWKKDLNLKVLSANKNVITEVIHKGIFFYGSFIYGEPDVAKRCTIWNKLLPISANRDQPWFLTGDFNEIIDNSEKDGGPLRAEGSFAAFRDLLAQCDLFDLKHSGCPLSWRGVRRTHLVFCRLDRAMVNSLWANSFPTARSHYMEFNGSDHRPLVTIFDSVRSKSTRIFRYDRRLKDIQEVKDLITSIWTSSENLHSEMRLAKVRQALVKWSREKPLNRKETIERLKKELDDALSSHIADDELIHRLNNELLSAYKAEEDFGDKEAESFGWLPATRILSSFMQFLPERRPVIASLSSRMRRGTSSTRRSRLRLRLQATTGISSRPHHSHPLEKKRYRS